MQTHDSKPCEKSKENRAREEIIAEFDSYLLALNRADDTRRGYTKQMRFFMEWMESRGITDLRAVSRNDLEAYQAFLVAAGKCVMPTVQLKMRSLRRLYGYLEKTGRILVNPASGFRLPKLDRTLPKSIMTTDEVEGLLAAPDISRPKGTRDRAILETLYSTGIRVGELCGLDIADVDLNGGVLRVNAGKGAKDRVVPLGKVASHWIHQYLLTVRDALLRGRSCSKLFIGLRTGQLKLDGIRGLVTKYAKQAGIKKRVSPHSLRHAFATHMVAAGSDISHVQKLLGHTNITTTQIYLRIAPTDVKEMHARCHPAEKDPDPSLPDVPTRFSAKAPGSEMPNAC